MKQILKKFIFSFIVLLLGFFTYQIIIKTQHKNELKKAIQTIPNFKFTKLNNEPFTKSNLVKNKKTILINFNSECHYCQAEANGIKKHLSEFKNIQIVFISSEPIEKIKSFQKKYQLNIDNIIFLQDKKDSFSEIFDTSVIPTLIIYDENQHLISKHKGLINTSRLLQLVNNKNE